MPLTLIGVGHVFKIANAVRREIFARMPKLICVELDKIRYEALLQRTRTKSNMPITYRLLALLQDSVAHKYGVEIGEEMLAAVSAARSIKADVAFIDMDARLVFNRLWTKMSFAEKAKLLIAGFGGLFASKKHITAELRQFEKQPDKYLHMLGREFPTIKKVLIDDRNAHMAACLRTLSSRYASIIAIVGDGHIVGLERLLHDLKPETIRLRELMGAGIAKRRNYSTVSYTFTTDKICLVI